MSFPSVLRVSNLQRIVLTIYFLSLAYCLVWIPWRSTTTLSKYPVVTIIYSFVWRAPGCDCPYDNGIEPDMRLILLRVAAVTAIAGAAVLLGGIARRPASI
jgi:hypothetical protein